MPSETNRSFAPESLPDNPDKLMRALQQEDGRENRYEFYRKFRSISPVVRTRWGAVVTGHAECMEVLMKPEVFGQPSATYYDRIIPGWRQNDRSLQLSTASALLLDPPEHTPHHQLFAAIMKRHLGNAQAIVERQADRVLDDLGRELSSYGRAEIVSTVSWPFIITVVGELLGFSQEESLDLIQPLKEFALGIVEFLRPPEQLKRANVAIEHLEKAVSDKLELRRIRPVDDILSDVVRERSLSAGDVEVLANSILILSAGAAVPISGVGNAITALDRFPDQRRTLLDGSTPPARAISELLRYDPPAHLAFRRIRTQTTLAGVALGPDEAVYAFTAAADRDPRRWDQPDLLRWDRNTGQALTFGHGVHYCLGASLARLELEVLLPRLYTRFPGLRVVESKRASTITLHGHEYLYVAA